MSNSNSNRNDPEGDVNMTDADKINRALTRTKASKKAAQPPVPPPGVPSAPTKRSSPGEVIFPTLVSPPVKSAILPLILDTVPGKEATRPPIRPPPGAKGSSSARPPPTSDTRQPGESDQAYRDRIAKENAKQKEVVMQLTKLSQCALLLKNFGFDSEDGMLSAFKFIKRFGATEAFRNWCALMINYLSSGDVFDLDEELLTVHWKSMKLQNVLDNLKSLKIINDVFTPVNLVKTLVNNSYCELKAWRIEPGKVYKRFIMVFVAGQMVREVDVTTRSDAINTCNDLIEDIKAAGKHNVLYSKFNPVVDRVANLFLQYCVIAVGRGDIPIIRTRTFEEYKDLFERASDVDVINNEMLRLVKLLEFIERDFEYKKEQHNAWAYHHVYKAYSISDEWKSIIEDIEYNTKFLLERWMEVEDDTGKKDQVLKDFSTPADVYRVFDEKMWDEAAVVFVNPNMEDTLFTRQKLTAKMSAAFNKNNKLGRINENMAVQFHVPEVSGGSPRDASFCSYAFYLAGKARDRFGTPPTILFYSDNNTQALNIITYLMDKVNDPMFKTLSKNDPDTMTVANALKDVELAYVHEGEEKYQHSKVTVVKRGSPEYVELLERDNVIHIFATLSAFAVTGSSSEDVDQALIRISTDDTYNNPNHYYIYRHDHVPAVVNAKFCDNVMKRGFRAEHIKHPRLTSSEVFTLVEANPIFWQAITVERRYVAVSEKLKSKDKSKKARKSSSMEEESDKMEEDPSDILPTTENFQYHPKFSFGKYNTQNGQKLIFGGRVYAAILAYSTADKVKVREFMIEMQNACILSTLRIHWMLKARDTCTAIGLSGHFPPDANIKRFPYVEVFVGAAYVHHLRNKQVTNKKGKKIASSDTLIALTSDEAMKFVRI